MYKGDLKGAYSRKLNKNDRVVYNVLPNTENIRDPKTGKPYDGIVNIVSLLKHYPE